MTDDMTQEHRLTTPPPDRADEAMAAPASLLAADEEQAGASPWELPSQEAPLPRRSFTPPVVPAANQAPRSPRRNGLVTVVLVAVISSLVTTGALGLGGAFDHAVAPSPTPTAIQTSVQPTPTTPAPVTDSVVNAVQSALPAVVTIVSSDQQSLLSPNLPFTTQATAIGSGVIIDAHGWILTNRHVVAGASSLSIRLADGRIFSGTTYGINTLTDLAIVKITGDNFPTVTLGNSSAIEVGQDAVVIGSPLGDYTNSASRGIISAVGRTITVTDDQTGQPVTIRNLIQTDASINPGNSGGALLDQAGNLIGITTATAASAQGIGFAIPINIARPIIAEALAGKPLARPFLGINYQPVTSGADNLVGNGVKITAGNDAVGKAIPGVQAGSPAAAAGLKDGDLVLTVDGVAITAQMPLDTIMLNYAPGQMVTLSVQRGSTKMEVTVTLGTRPTAS